MIRAARIIAVCFATSVSADTPLALPKDFLVELDGISVEGDVAANTTTISSLDGTGFEAWTIPVWARWYRVSPDGQTALVLIDGGNLIGSRDPDQIVATVYSNENGQTSALPIALVELMRPEDMPTTTSHYLWLRNIETIEAGWRLHLGDGRSADVLFK